MRRLFLGLAASAVTALSSGTADAQFPVLRNKIVNSGNGVGNLVAAGNAGTLGFGAFGPGAGFQKNTIVTSGNGIGNTVLAGNLGGGVVPAGFPVGVPIGYPVGYPGVGFPGGGVPGLGGGLNINVVTNSGNGIGNKVLTGNLGGGGLFGGGIPGLGGGLNINVVTNSGNGAGNLIGLLNR
jgi:hypothetical protein